MQAFGGRWSRMRSLRKLDISKAKAGSGREGGLNRRGYPGRTTHGLVVFDWPVMVGIGERIRYVGDALAIVAAETQDAADASSRLDRA